MIILLRADLVVANVDDEIVVFDPKSNEAHCLSGKAAELFTICQKGEDLPTQTPEIAEVLERFEDLGFFPQDSVFEKTTRRQALKTLGKVAAIPLIASIALPSPAAAQSASVTEAACEASGGTACGTPCSGFPISENRVCGATAGAGSLCGCVSTPPAVVCSCT